MQGPPDQPLQAIQPPDWAPPRGYQNGIVAPAGRRLLAVAGQIGWDERCQLVQAAPGEDAFVVQFAQALRNVLTVVRCAGGEATDVMSLRLYVTDKQRYLRHSKAVGSAYRALFGRHYPAMAAVQVVDLVEDGALVEIEALAALP
jgi:enamine deaminase RidA (YjgF/YER057c/UK114 family)